MSATRTITIVSALLGLGTFVGVLAVGPVSTRRSPPVALSRPRPSTVATIQQIRNALNERRPRAALNLSSVAADARPNDPDAWLWLAYTRKHFGDPARAVEAAERLLMLVDGSPDAAFRSPGPAPDVRENSGTAYRRAWAYEILGRDDEAKIEFRKTADLYESEVRGFRSPGVEYNLACYRAMGGQTEIACQHFENWAGSGPSDGGWWSVDPDLDPLRALPRFQEAAEGLTPAPPAPRPDLGPDPTTDPVSPPGNG